MTAKDLKRVTEIRLDLASYGPLEEIPEEKELQAIGFLLAKLDEAQAALLEIAEQKTVAEIEEDENFDLYDGDMEGAYDMMIERARQATGKE